jgi:hypothetical protein
MVPFWEKRLYCDLAAQVRPDQMKKLSYQDQCQSCVAPWDASSTSYNRPAGSAKAADHPISYPETRFYEMNVGAAWELVDFFQPTTQPTKTYVLYDFRVVWQSPRSCKLSFRAFGPRNPMKIT